MGAGCAGPIGRNRRPKWTSKARFELRYRSLFNEGRGYAFPCDGAGRVDMDTLSEIARCNYFDARAVVGRELSLPVVQASAAH